MLPAASRDRRRKSIVFAGLRPALASAILSSALLASPPAPRVLLIVPPGAELAVVDRARSAVPPPQTFLLVAESGRVRLKGGLEFLVDLPFADAPAADLVVLLSGSPGPAENAFLMERKKTARALLLPPDSLVAERLKAAEGGALLLLGGSDAVPAVLEGIGAAGGGTPPAPAPPTSSAVAPTRGVTARPTSTPTRGATGRIFDRYFSASPATPTPTPR